MSGAPARRQRNAREKKGRKKKEGIFFPSQQQLPTGLLSSLMEGQFLVPGSHSTQTSTLSLASRLLLPVLQPRGSAWYICSTLHPHASSNPRPHVNPPTRPSPAERVLLAPQNNQVLLCHRPPGGGMTAGCLFSTCPVIRRSWTPWPTTIWPHMAASLPLAASGSLALHQSQRLHSLLSASKAQNPRRPHVLQRLLRSAP